MPSSHCSRRWMEQDENCVPQRTGAGSRVVRARGTIANEARVRQRDPLRTGRDSERDDCMGDLSAGGYARIGRQMSC